MMTISPQTFETQSLLNTNCEGSEEAYMCPGRQWYHQTPRPLPREGVGGTWLCEHRRVSDGPSQKPDSPPPMPPHHKALFSDHSPWDPDSMCSDALLR